MNDSLSTLPELMDVHAEQPLRGELLSLEHLRVHAASLAKSLKVARHLGKDRRFHQELEQNAEFLHSAHRTISQSIREGEPLTPEAEWLLDNYYVVEEHLRQIRDDLPRSYFDELPKLANRTPRIYQIALDLIVHTDSVVQQDDLAAFVDEFQSVSPLSIGEMWALPIMLRLALVENLRRLAAQMLANLKIRNGLASILSAWKVGDGAPNVLRTESPRPDLISNAFTILGDLFSNDPPRFAALEQLLMEEFPSSTELIRAEHRRQAANQVSIGNVITSMRLISALDWMKFFEQTSLTERVLRQDPTAIYPQMSPETRNRYRNAVEDLAKQSRQTDLYVAEQALKLATAAVPTTQLPSSTLNHIGYWLVDDGRKTLEQRVGYQPRWGKVIPRWMLAHPQITYFGSIGIIVAVGLLLYAGFAVRTQSSWPIAIILLIATILPLSEFAVSLTNWLVTNRVPPRLLPKLDLKDGVPADFRTFVIVPSMLTGRKEITALLDRLEMHYVGNSDPELRFALLTDFSDAPSEEMEKDAALIEYAVTGIRKLNSSYGQNGIKPFYLFHRKRKWNDREGCWMGWERKRGKLMEFNQILHGDKQTSYSVIEGDLSVLVTTPHGPAFPFVITLDADTQLPLGAARSLIGTLAHPLNRVQLNPDETQVTRGYSILQPRVTVQLSEGNKSRFTQLFANAKGIDPYATAASDVYQDLFGEGSFTGKGIYDVRCFETILNRAFGENQILSHDLIEGCHARVALVSDIEVIDGYPVQYDADARRNHRWVRGDWQLLPWIFPSVPYQDGVRPNRLSLLSRWKIVDNLRRSLVAPATCLLLVCSWLLASSFANVWGISAWLCMAFPVLAGLTMALLQMPRREFWISRIRSIRTDLLHTLVQTVVLIACLPHKAYSMVDAIVRTLVRLTITRRNMLEWETAAAAERRLAKRPSSILLKMSFVPIISIGLMLILRGPAWSGAWPWLAAWIVSPVIAYSISLPIRRRQLDLSTDEKDWLRLLAKSSWSYFESCVGEKTNWLPPDNLQEYPEERLAERISPTNEGLFLVSALIARDFGFLGLHSLLDLCEKNLTAWRSLPQLNGHFFNWYDTSTLQPLMPRYVSTVDSGNLVASLLVLERGLDDTCRSPVFSDAVWQGLHDTLALAIHACEQLQPRGARMMSPPLDDLTIALSKHLGLLKPAPKTWKERNEVISAVRLLHKELPRTLRSFLDSHRHPTTEVEPTVRSVIACLGGLEADYQRLVPWAFSSVAADDRLQQTNAGEELLRRWSLIQTQLQDSQTLEHLIQLPQTLSEEIAAVRALVRQRSDQSGSDSGLVEDLEQFQADLDAAGKAALLVVSRCRSIGLVAEKMALDMKFQFLFNPERQLFAIGYNVEDGKVDRSHYDMLCSEARLASHLAIAKGDVSHKHWFHLGRQSTIAAGQLGLLSWGGTMFEFLMPVLFQRRFEGSLLSQACETAVARQQEYGRQTGVPWGVSESAFAALAINTDYNYRSFGVPGLGLKRGLSDDLVIAPYATMLALTIAPTAATANLRRLAAEGALGKFGFYDAIDYSPVRVPAGKKALPVRCYMAHHQAMSIAAIANLILDQIIERRFHAHPIVRATEMLLQESIPDAAPVLLPNSDETAEVRTATPEEMIVSRRLVGYESPSPRTHLLSNGNYSLMVTNTGGGYSQLGEIGVTRWRPDGLNDFGGQFIYIRDRKTGRTWSATYQPTCAKPDFYEVVYSIDKAEYRRRDGNIETTLEIVVSPDNNVEHRQLKISNRGRQACDLEITSYVEITLVTPAADLAHPAFQKLFVETEYIAEESALIAQRRPRAAQDDKIWALHVLASPDVKPEDIQHESSRQEFLGRGRDPRRPRAVESGGRLSGTTGAVIDPIFSLRCGIIVTPQSSVSLAFTTGMATSREEALRLADQFHESRSVLRAFELAWVFNQVQLHHMHLTAAKAQRFQQLASLILFPQSHVRGPEASLRNNHQSQNGLWRFGISGDRPILLVNVAEAEHVEFVRDLLLAHHYWEHHGLTVDLVILNTHPGSYIDILQELLQRIIQEAPHRPVEARNAIFLLRAAQFPLDDRWLLESTARVVIEARRGWLTVVSPPAKPRDNLPDSNRVPATRAKTENTVLVAASGADESHSPYEPASDLPYCDTHSSHALTRAADLEFWNGYGGFGDEGREYSIRLQASQPTPAPWSNVIANARFGCLVTEIGGGYTWSGNSRQNKLTTWSNDPVTDPPSEVVYLRDDESREIWLPLMPPQSSKDEAWAHHGQGYTRFVRNDHGLDQEVRITIAPEDPVKFVFVTLQNNGPVERRITAAFYADFVLGVNREQSQLHLITSDDAENNALLVRNAYHATSPNQVAFLRVIGPDRSLTGDRTGFLGRNGDLRNPNGLQNTTLSGKTGAGLDPCGVVQTQFTIPGGESVEIAFLLGCGETETEAQELLKRYQTIESSKGASDQTVSGWNDILTAVQVETPNRAFDIMVNRWLLYQVLSCRLWGRSAFYQSGGAYGFRDQLQDSMAMVYSRPDLTRAHILRAASHQFVEGDVQHWWHPPLGEGTRTRFSDDLLWLPYVVAHYVHTTGDEKVLNEILPYLRSPSLAPEEQERYETPQVAAETGPLYEHCLRALERGFKLGEHGLPLMGCGDWNDGMNHVGADGRGESVWVGWFLLKLVDEFIPLVEYRGDTGVASHYRERAAQLRESLERHAWDGEWYRRAFFDDGTPLGSHKNDECQIDSIVQSWAVLAHAEENRTDQAIESVFDRLVSMEHRLVKLFEPPFDKTVLDPGYIKGYLPGVRENGGQYTHAVLWLIEALTMKGDGDRAMELFDFVNPILHSATPAEVKKYCVEPYVVVADVYSLVPHVGRGGWSWYTGSAAWTYRVAIESILGMTVRGRQLRFQPQVPNDWEQFHLTMRIGSATWHFTVETSQKDEQTNNGGSAASRNQIPTFELVDDGIEHHEVIHLDGNGAQESQSAPGELELNQA